MKNSIKANGEKISALRIQKQLTQDRLAEAAGVNIKSVQRAEKGEHLQIETLKRVANALEVSYSELIFEEAEEGLKLLNVYKGQDLVELLNGADLFQYKVEEGGKFKKDIRVAYDALQNMKEYFEVWSMLEPTQIGEASEEFDKTILALAKEGFLLYVSNSRTKKGEFHMPMDLNLATIIIYPADHPDVRINPEFETALKEKSYTKNT